MSNGSSGPKDPNEATEPRGNITTPKLPMGDIEKDLPLTETPTPFSGLKEGGGGAGA